MYNIRARNTTNALVRQQRHLIEISATGDNIPLHCTNWPERWCTLPEDFQKMYSSIYEFEVKSDDVFVVTFPKCGTTWIQEAAWLLMNNLDYEQALSTNLTKRSVFMDISAIYDHVPVNSVEQAAQAKSPRLLKTHLPAHLIPKQIWEKKTKLIYCGRNPKDVVVSYFHFHRGLGTWQGTMDEFLEDFIANDIIYTPYFPHLLDFWQMRNESHIFFTTFEEMKTNLPAVLKRLCNFLERPPLSEEEMARMLKHLSFESMKKNKRTNLTYQVSSVLVLPDFQFMRRGIVGAYKIELSPYQLEQLDNWTEEVLKNYNANINLAEIFGVIN